MLKDVNNYRPKLSICISSYNQLSFLKENLVAIELQDIDYTYEIIVCDDGSSDGSYGYLNEWKSSRDSNMGMTSNCKDITIMQQKRDIAVKEYPNWRHARVIIRMLEAVRGEYFILLDGDDYLCGENTVNDKIAILDNEQNSDCVICMSNMKRVYDKGIEEVATQDPLPTKRTLAETFFHFSDNWNPDPYLHIACGVVRSSVIPTLVHEYCQDIADWGIYFWIMNYGKRYYLPEVGFAYRIHDGTIWSGEKSLLSSMRNVLGDDVRNIWWNKKYKRALELEHYYNIKELYQNRLRLHKMIDVDLWKPCVNRYPGLVKLIFDYSNVSLIEKFKIDFLFSCILLKGFLNWIHIGIRRKFL